MLYSPAIFYFFFAVDDVCTFSMRIVSGLFGKNNITYATFIIFTKRACIIYLNMKEKQMYFT